MYGELTAITDAGRRFVALAEEHAADFATRAAGHDRDGSFPVENFEAMKQSGFLAGPVPEEFGGLGLFSYHDIGVGLSRLARGDGSTAIAANMHLSSVWTMHRLLRVIQAGGTGPPQAILEGLLKGIGAGQIVVAVPATEAGTTVRYPKTEAVRTGGGYVLNGHKIFGTLSPIATLFFSTARLANGNGGYESVLCMLGKDTEGVEVKDNWDALGMRASGSGDVIYRDVRLGEGNVVQSGQPLGEMTIGANDPGTANHGLLGAFVGIAEAAAEIVIEQAKTRRKSPSDKLMAERHWMQHLIGEMDIDLTICRGMLAYEGRAIDAMVEQHPTGGMPDDEKADMERLHQGVKHTINRRAIDVVDKALTASGGAGYMSKHPLARLYRDVRAGPFMQPYSPPEGIEFIGRIVLGQDSNVDL
jgi:alkylation response protein AidB-like acyl-CoA dehydrogenase